MKEYIKSIDYLIYKANPEYGYYKHFENDRIATNYGKKYNVIILKIVCHGRTDFQRYINTETLHEIQ